MYSMMIVDDEPLTRQYVKLNVPLINEKWQVTLEAMEGQEALDLLNNTTVDLVVTDIKMPIMDGLKLCKELYEKYPKVKIIILSGYDEFSFAKEAIKYGVSEYLLKPIVKEQFKQILEKITKQIEEEQSREATYNAMISLSQYSKKQIITDFFRAVLLDSTVKIKSLLPMIYKLKISIIESEAAILLLSFDEESVLFKSADFNEITILKFILNQLSEEEAEKNNYLVCLDEDSNNAILITGESKIEIQNKCSGFYNGVSSKFTRATGMTLTGGIGMSVCDEQQLNISYNGALQVLICSLFKGNGQIFHFEEYNNYSNEISSLNKFMEGIKSALIENSEVLLSASIINLIDWIDDHSTDVILRYGIFIIKSVSELNTNITDEIKERAIKMLKSLCTDNISFINRDKIIKTFKYITKYVSNSSLIETEMINDKDLIDKTREYIFEHYNEPISLALIADKIGVSSSYLSNIFHKSTGQSYIKFLTRVRMEQAGKLLKEVPPIKIYDISEKVGYVSVKHFSFIFKKYYNMSPSEYQKINNADTLYQI